MYSTSSEGSTTIPMTPGALPFLGHGLALLRDPLGFFGSLPAHGDLVRVCIGPLTTVVVCDPELTRRVFLDDRTYDKGGPFYDRVREVLGDGVATCPYSRHRRQRRLVQPAFHSDRIPGYARVMGEQIEAVTGAWRAGQVIDARAEMMKLTARVTLATIFSDSMPPQALHQAVDDLVTVLNGIYLRMITPPPLDRIPTPTFRRYRQAIHRLRSSIGQIISERRANSGDDHGDLLSALLAARDLETGQGLSDEEVSDQAVTFFVGGTETTATALAWSLYLLGQHPDVAKRVRAEVDAVAPAGAVVYDDLPRLSLVKNILNEALRMWPPVGWVASRTVARDTWLGQHAIPARTAVICSLYLLHRRPDLHPAPEMFDPDRWQSHPRSRASFMPFAAGARKCIGDTFAMAEAALALATIAGRWHVEPMPGNHVRPRPRASLTPQGLRMRTVARKTSA
ncbi:cytochrome P450 [Streptomyces sp. NPDC090442]|uniref:cytochrome P450 n=1 Tax=Streptomyces sp. NPDC090442 TaxID=3365962 RepID=UPI0037F8FBB1